MANVSLTRDQYDLLLEYAYGTIVSDVALVEMQRKIDAANGIKRYALLLRWMETGGAAPTRIELGKGWPVSQQFLLKMDRPIAREDVDNILRTQATRPVSVTVTPDVRGVLGWTELEVWSF